MQANDGHMVGINQKQFDELKEHGSTNIIRIGDVFKVRSCYFRVEGISNCGMEAKGISKREYFEAKKVTGQIEP